MQDDSTSNGSNDAQADLENYVEMFEAWSVSRRPSLEEILQEAKSESGSDSDDGDMPLGPPPPLRRQNAQVWRKFETGPYLL